MRYRDMVDAAARDRRPACRFLGIREGHVSEIPATTRAASPSPAGGRPCLARSSAAGARARHQFAPPYLWRRASVPLVSGSPRTGQALGRASPPYVSDSSRVRRRHRTVSLVTGEDFSDWNSTVDRGSFAQRASARSRRRSARDGLLTRSAYLKASARIA